MQRKGHPVVLKGPVTHRPGTHSLHQVSLFNSIYSSHIHTLKYNRNMLACIKYNSLFFLKKFNHIHDHFTYYIKHRLSGYTICLNTGEGEGASRTTSSTQGTSETTLPPADTSPSTIPAIQGEPIDPADWPALCDQVRTELVCRGP